METQYQKAVPSTRNAIHVMPDAELVANFWQAPEDALFKQPTVAKVLNRSEAWCERGRWAGYGPRYIKIGRGVDYRKRDVLDWLNKYRSVNSTSECLGAAA